MSAATNPVASSRVLYALNLVLFAISIVAIAVVIVFFSRREMLRVRIDATKTRAYSLSDQTRQLLASLQGEWKIAMVLSEKRVDRAMRRQIDEVLKRYTDASPRISVMRIDPENPQTLGEYDAMISELQRVYANDIAAYDRALDAGIAAFLDFQSFAQRESGILEQVVARMPADDPDRSMLTQRTGTLAIAGDQGGTQLLAAVRKARRTDSARPLPDYDAARSALAAALMQQAVDCDELAGVFARWQERSNADASVKQFATIAGRDFQQISQKLAEAADPLKRLPIMELSSIGAQLQQGECAIIISPKRAAIISSAQLIPKSNLQQHENLGVSFDQRFRGEQLLSAAIRSLTVPIMPLVVFVHASEESMLRPRDKQNDLVGGASVLKISRYSIAEWMVDKPGDRPAPAKGQTAVWVIVPPAQRSLQVSKAEQALLTATTKLIDDGEPVLLSVFPSMLPRYGQRDPWATVAAPFGITLDTAHVVYERFRADETQSQNRIAQLMSDFETANVIGRAANGQDAKFALPVPIRNTNDAPAGVERSTIAAIQPNTNRWLETRWSADPAQDIQPAGDAILRDPVPVMVSAERRNPVKSGQQRLVAVGVGTWILSFDADVVVPIGGNRIALVYPGNYELLLASIAWLAGMDDLIAASPMSQEISRLNHVTPEIRSFWSWIIIGGIPGACLLLGAIVWYVRRT